MKRKPKVYVAGKYSSGDVMQNIYNAVSVGDWIFELGAVPFIPHLTGFWNLIASHDYETWMKYDEEWLKSCDALFRMAGDSSGADREVKMAKKLGIPVFLEINQVGKFLEWISSWAEENS